MDLEVVYNRNCRSQIDKHYPVQRVTVWRQELAYMTFGEKYDSFQNKNEYHEEMNKLFGVVFYNPPQVCDKPLWSLLDYTHNLNRFKFIRSRNIPTFGYLFLLIWESGRAER